MGVLESFAIDHNSGLPVWIQIKNRIAYLIGSGAFVPGDRLPTVRALAVDLDISYNTVNRAYMDLEREGYITTRKGTGHLRGRTPRPGGAHGIRFPHRTRHRRHDPRLHQRRPRRRRHRRHGRSPPRPPRLHAGVVAQTESGTKVPLKKCALWQQTPLEKC